MPFSGAIFTSLWNYNQSILPKVEHPKWPVYYKDGFLLSNLDLIPTNNSLSVYDLGQSISFFAFWLIVLSRNESLEFSTFSVDDLVIASVAQIPSKQEGNLLTTYLGDIMGNLVKNCN